MFKRWVLRLFLLVTGLINVARGVQALQWIPVLRYPQGFQPELSIPLPAVGMFYGVLALSSFLILITQWRVNKPRIIIYWAIGYQVVLWTIHLLTDVSSYSRILWSRNAGLTVLFLVVVYWLSRPKKRKRKQNQTA